MTTPIDQPAAAEHDDVAAQLVFGALSERDLTDLLDDICERRRVTRLDVCGLLRTRAVAHARHELWWRLRNHPELTFSLEEIGRIFRRHHVTILQGVRAHAARLASTA
jgi:chromosomal replication initiation ATPase DnaA